jgi:hypothetical protein
MSEELANHSQEVIETSTTETTESDSGYYTETEAETVPQEQPKGITVKYNKEEKFVPEEELPTWVQKGLNYDKVQQRATELETQAQTLDRVAKFYGYQTHDEFVQAFEQVEQQRRIEEESKRMGVDETVIRDYFQPMNQKLQQYETELQTLKQQETMRKVEQEINQLRTKYEDFDQYQDAIFDMAMNRGYELEHAYRIASYDDRIQRVAQQKEQEVLAKVTARDQKQVLPSNDAPNNIQFDPANMTSEDIKRISERVQRGERITF